MTKTLYLHVETTGRFLFREPVIHIDQPHLVRLAMLLADEDKVVGDWCQLVQPVGHWVFEPDAVVAHGITQAQAKADGVRLSQVMVSLLGALEGADRVCAFNVDFAVKVLQRSAFECHLNYETLFSGHTLACAMRRATDIVQKPRMEPGGGYLWPKFAEAYRFFAHQDLPSMDLDPVERGKALVRAVYTIDQGILANQRATPHE